MMTDTGRFLHIQASKIDSERARLRAGQVLMFRDVSDVEKAQSDVLKNEKLLRTLIDHSVNGILRLRWVQDEGDDFRKLRCIFANAMAGKFLNADREDLVDCTGAQIVRIASNAMDPDVANPGLALAGYIQRLPVGRIQVFGETEIWAGASTGMLRTNFPPGSNTCTR